MGGDFQQYRANVACGRPDCAYTANLGKLLSLLHYSLYLFGL